MKKEIAIEVKNVKKKFKIYYDKGYMLKEKALRWSRNRYEERWVLNGISFSVKKGEAVGIIGHNGCGKSTTLKLLTKIIYPDSGEIIMNGRVSSLIELGAGFHPDLSGRENIYINASIFGLTRKEINKRIKNIIDFSELGEYIDNPVRTYSSGMYMRLAFSVAINVDADILLIDEILAVGDANFQQKCFEKMIEIKQKGTTIVIVSHSLGQIEQICERTIWLHGGLIKEEGAPHIVHRQYLDYMAEERKRVQGSGENSQNQESKILLKDAFITDVLGERRILFDTAEDVCINVSYVVNHPVTDGVFSVCITRNDGLYCFGETSRSKMDIYYSLIKDGILKIEFRNIGLLGGKYDVSIGIENKQGENINFVKNICSFEIKNSLAIEGAFRLNSIWQLEE